jgi:hypothetical protein
MYNLCCLAADSLVALHNDDSPVSEAQTSADYGLTPPATAVEDRLRQVARTVRPLSLEKHHAFLVFNAVITLRFLTIRAAAPPLLPLLLFEHLLHRPFISKLKVQVLFPQPLVRKAKPVSALLPKIQTTMKREQGM